MQGSPEAPATAANAASYIPPAAPAARSGHSPLIAFLLGFVPGLGAVYNGEYNKAIVHIVVFGGIILTLNSDFGENMQGFLIFLICIFPFYMAIDAMRSAKAKATGEPLTDPLANLSEQRSLGPMILIGLGVLFLLRNFHVFDYFRVQQFFVPLLLIGIGFFMLKNRFSGRN